VRQTVLERMENSMLKCMDTTERNMLAWYGHVLVMEVTDGLREYDLVTGRKTTMRTTGSKVGKGSCEGFAADGFKM
jgi:hypothetical protein